MKKVKQLLSITILAGALAVSSFAPKPKPQAKLIPAFFWFTPSGTFVYYGTLVSVVVVTGDSLDPTGGTLNLEGYTAETTQGTPAGNLVFKLYSHP